MSLVRTLIIGFLSLLVSGPAYSQSLFCRFKPGRGLGCPQLWSPIAASTYDCSGPLLRVLAFLAIGMGGSASGLLGQSPFGKMSVRGTR